MLNKTYSLTIFFILAALLLSGCGTPALAQDKSEMSTRTLVVTGSGKAYLTPDVAYISVGVHTEDKDAAKAVAANNTQSEKVSKALLELDIDAKDIQTTNFSIYPQQQYDQNGKMTGILYMVDNSVYVTLRDIEKIGNLLNTVVEAGANSINGVQFDVSDKTEALSDARKDAVKNAQAQAKELAEAAGVKLGAIQTLSSYGGIPAPVFEGKGGGGAIMAVDTPVSPGQLVLTVDVNLVYEIQ